MLSSVCGSVDDTVCLSTSWYLELRTNFRR